MGKTLEPLIIYVCVTPKFSLTCRTTVLHSKYWIQINIFTNKQIFVIFFANCLFKEMTSEKGYLDLVSFYIYIYIYSWSLECSMYTVYRCLNIDCYIWAAICKTSAIFGMVCKFLSALTARKYNSKLNACISLNIHKFIWWMRDGWRINLSGVIK